MHSYPMQYRHCTRPPCMDGCPEHAITQQAAGIVLISEEQCMDCLKCAEACPFGARECHPGTGVGGQCTLCVERIDGGNVSSCVYHCPTGALGFGDPNELIGSKQRTVVQEELRNF